jgi:hypothetical protein
MKGITIITLSDPDCVAEVHNSIAAAVGEEPMRQHTFSVGEIKLILEALAYRAARLESMARSAPRTAGKLEGKAAAMRDLRGQLCRSQLWSEMAGKLAGDKRA